MPVSVNCYITDTGAGLYLTVRCMGQEDRVGPIKFDVDYPLVFDPPALQGNETNAKRLRKKATQLETKLAESIGGRRHKGSGSLGHLKSDGSLKGKVRLESKFTQCKSFQLTLADLYKLTRECEYKEDPAYEITFVEPGTLKTVDQWVVITRQAWERYIAATYPTNNR